MFVSLYTGENIEIFNVKLNKGFLSLICRNLLILWIFCRKKALIFISMQS